MISPARSEKHYTRHTSGNASTISPGQSGVIQFISIEYTGPLHFIADSGWIAIGEMGARKRQKTLWSRLSTTKDVQDSILADPKYAALVELSLTFVTGIAAKNGTDYAPEGGKNLAPRQHARIQKTGKVSFNSVYNAVLEYKKKYPEKAVLYHATRCRPICVGGNAGGWLGKRRSGFTEGVFEASGSMLPEKSEGKYILSGAGEG